MKILYITTIGETMGFFRSFIRVLLKDGHTVDIATNENSGTTAVQEYYREWGCKVYPIPCSRSPLKIGNIKAIKEIHKIVANGNYDIAHCHTPIAAACTRFACRSLRKKNLKVFYTAHGFHFYTGAPIKNWLIYYPVEWLCSWYTDILITINKEDYERAKKRFHAKQIKYVPGVGVDTEKFAPRKSGREATRAELGLKDSDIMLLSVGEMNENKNHISVIRAIKGLSDLVYVIVGKGEKEQELVRAAKENDVDLKLTGFRTDVADVYDAADVYVLPSIREGLNVSLMEAMASGLACCCGNIRGNTDLIEEKAVLFDPLDTDEIKAAISTAIEDRTELGKKNHEKIRSFDLSTIENLTSEIYMGGGMSNLVALLKRQAKRTEIGMPLDAKLLISVGELSVRKNHKVLVEALQELPKNYWYAIVGRGSLKEELENVDHTGRLKLLGFRKDIVDLLHASDVFVFPSLQEGLPVALMEAMAAGLPCIASKIRGNEDLINKSRLVKCDDIEKWIQVIESTATTIPNEDNCGLENIFKIDTVLDKMWEIYRGGVTYLERLFKIQQIRKSIGVPLDSKLIISVGELNKNKNHKVVIQAISKLNDPSIHYAVAGSGELREYLKDTAKSMGVVERVHFLGFRDDVTDLYKAADICIFPSIREGLGLAAIEGMASGLPLICADNRGTRDYAVDGENAIVCRYDSIDDFVNAIQTILPNDSLRIKLSKNGMEKAKLFDHKNVNHMMKKIYSRI